jgi:hypothetical protein
VKRLENYRLVIASDHLHIHGKFGVQQLVGGVFILLMALFFTIPA